MKSGQSCYHGECPGLPPHLHRSPGVGAVLTSQGFHAASGSLFLRCSGWGALDASGQQSWFRPDVAPGHRVWTSSEDRPGGARGWGQGWGAGGAAGRLGKGALILQAAGPAHHCPQASKRPHSVCPWSRVSTPPALH